MHSVILQEDLATSKRAGKEEGEVSIIVERVGETA